jgi:hypothetical protein
MKHHHFGNVSQPLVDLAAFPILTQEVGYPPSPVTRTGAGAGAIPQTGSGAGLGQTALKAVADVLGWKVKTDDAKGFTGALAQAFTLTEVEGHVKATWVPRTYAVQSDLSGGITGAQASLYSRAKFTLDQALPLLDGLRVLNPSSTPEDAEALRAVVRSQMTELVGELPYAGGPRVSRVNQYFHLLLGRSPGEGVVTDPDLVGGTLGNLREVFGLATLVQEEGFMIVDGEAEKVGRVVQNSLVNTIDDEQCTTNFRVLSDYLTSLAQTWVSNLRFFGLGSARPFLGTQLVLISRQLSVTAELVDELRFAFDSVFIGPSERQTLRLIFHSNDDPIYLEDLLLWIQTLVTDEAPAVIQSGGKFGVHQVHEMVRRLHRLVKEAADPADKTKIPKAYFAPRVTITLQTLAVQLAELSRILSQVETKRLPVDPT